MLNSVVVDDACVFCDYLIFVGLVFGLLLLVVSLL